MSPKRKPSGESNDPFTASYVHSLLWPSYLDLEAAFAEVCMYKFHSIDIRTVKPRKLK